MTEAHRKQLEDEGVQKLVHPGELEVGERYLIISGDGEGEEGKCIEKRSSKFGHHWGDIETSTGVYPTRWHLLAHA